MKISPTLNNKEEFEYKKKKLLSSKELSKFKKQFNLDYIESKKLISKIREDKQFENYYKKQLKMSGFIWDISLEQIWSRILLAKLVISEFLLLLLQWLLCLF